MTARFTVTLGICVAAAGFTVASLFVHPPSSASDSPAYGDDTPSYGIDTPAGTNVEIYHAAHGKSEDYAAIRTFVPMTINGEATLLAGFTCTPLVRFEVEGLRPGSRT